MSNHQKDKIVQFTQGNCQASAISLRLIWIWKVRLFHSVCSCTIQQFRCAYFIIFLLNEWLAWVTLLVVDIETQQTFPAANNACVCSSCQVLTSCGIRFNWVQSHSWRRRPGVTCSIPHRPLAHDVPRDELRHYELTNSMNIFFQKQNACFSLKYIWWAYMFIFAL
jgi:magnesium-transporting ATPase (P-type)